MAQSHTEQHNAINYNCTSTAPEIQRHTCFGLIRDCRCFDQVAGRQFTDTHPLIRTPPHLDGVDERHEAQAAEVDVQGVAQRPHQVIPGRILALCTTHVHHRGARRLAARLWAVGERGAVRGVVVRVVIHSGPAPLGVTLNGFCFIRTVAFTLLPVDGCL